MAIKKELIVPGMVYKREGFSNRRVVLEVIRGNVYYGDTDRPKGKSSMINNIDNMVNYSQFTLLEYGANCSTAINYSIF